MLLHTGSGYPGAALPAPTALLSNHQALPASHALSMSCHLYLALSIYLLVLDLANSSFKGPGSKYVRLSSPDGFCCIYIIYTPLKM